MSQVFRSTRRGRSPLARRAARWAASPLLAAALLASAAGAAQAASPARSIKYDVPSTKGYVDARTVQFNDSTKDLTAWVRLPEGYADQPDRKWPVLYLLHGWEDSSDAWLDPKKGSINTVLPADFDGIVVMPEGAKGWFINWASPTGNPGRQWGDYLLEEVVPFMERELRIAPGRANHAIGGLSMGGYGAMNAVAALPSYFGHALSFSGLLDNQDLNFTGILGMAQVGKPGWGSVFGSVTGPYAPSVNPLKHPREFAQSKVTVVYGTPPISVLWSLDIRKRGLALLEVGAQLQATNFVKAVKPTGAAVFTSNRNNGSHDWPWWRAELAAATARGLFTAPPVTKTSDATSWEYGTMARHGNAWGLGFKMITNPIRETTLVRNGSTLTGTGIGAIRISGGAADGDASGEGTRADCTFTLKLPFTQELPAGC